MNFKLNEEKLFALLLLIIILSGLSLFFQITNIDSSNNSTAAASKVGSKVVIEENPTFQPAPAPQLRYEFVELQEPENTWGTGVGDINNDGVAVGWTHPNGGPWSRGLGGIMMGKLAIYRSPSVVLLLLMALLA